MTHPGDTTISSEKLPTQHSTIILLSHHMKLINLLYAAHLHLICHCVYLCFIIVFS